VKTVLSSCFGVACDVSGLGAGVDGAGADGVGVSWRGIRLFLQMGKDALTLRAKFAAKGAETRWKCGNY